jgi:hypothetical protein
MKPCGGTPPGDTRGTGLRRVAADPPEPLSPTLEKVGPRSEVYPSKPGGLPVLAQRDRRNAAERCFGPASTMGAASPPVTTSRPQLTRPAHPCGRLDCASRNIRVNVVVPGPILAHRLAAVPEEYPASDGAGWSRCSDRAKPGIAAGIGETGIGVTVVLLRSAPASGRQAGGSRGRPDESLDICADRCWNPVERSYLERRSA